MKKSKKSQLLNKGELSTALVAALCFAMLFGIIALVGKAGASKAPEDRVYNCYVRNVNTYLADEADPDAIPQITRFGACICTSGYQTLWAPGNVCKTLREAND